jgi:hypothetical protein
MSALGHERTNRLAPKSTFVRFGPIADKRGRNWIVRFVPIADIQNTDPAKRKNAPAAPMLATGEQGLPTEANSTIIAVS